MNRNLSQLSRRDMLRLGGLGLAGFSASGWFPAFANALAADPARRRHCILLWMQGGPSQTDTFDMKPDHGNGGEFKEVATNVPGLRFSEHLPLLAQQAEQLAIVRSLSTREGDHNRGTHLVRTGHSPGTSVRYPSIACALAKELLHRDGSLPNYVSVGAPQLNPAAFGPGFLGPQYAPALVGESNPAAAAAPATPVSLRIENMELPPGIDETRAARRLEFWNAMQQGPRAHQAGAAHAHDSVFRQALAMMRGEARAAFDLSQEPEDVRAAYGPGQFGQGCLLARRLVERGVPFVEVALGGGLGWDTHANNFTQVRQLSEQLDAGWATLMRELADRGLLESTTILWIGEFGRTPVINQMAGRDHFPAAWSCVFAGGGIQGGQAYGSTTADGMEVEENKVAIGDVLSTLCCAVGVDPYAENISDGGRPIRITEGSPIEAILA